MNVSKFPSPECPRDCTSIPRGKNMKSHSFAEKSQYSTDQKETYQGFQARLLDALVRDVIHVMRAPFSLHTYDPSFRVPKSLVSKVCLAQSSRTWFPRATTAAALDDHTGLNNASLQVVNVLPDYSKFTLSPRFIRIDRPVWVCVATFHCCSLSFSNS